MINFDKVTNIFCIIDEYCGNFYKNSSNFSDRKK
jgi:hypothetical protein